MAIFSKRAIYDLNIVLDMIDNGKRYAVFYSGNVMRHPSMKPILHNGKKPRT